VGQLKQAILHRPRSRTFETDASNVESCSSTTCSGPRRRREHDAFAQALRDKGRERSIFRDLFTDVLATVDGRAFVLDTLITDENRASLVKPVRAC